MIYISHLLAKDRVYKKMKNKLKNVTALFGKEVEFAGNMRFFGTARVDGYFKGKILGEGTLIIGEEAKIESEIHASTVINYGEIRGNIIAEKEINLCVPGKVYGNIEAPVIQIEKGVVFEGKSLLHEPVLIDDEELDITKTLKRKNRDKNDV